MDNPWTVRLIDDLWTGTVLTFEYILLAAAFERV